MSTITRAIILFLVLGYSQFCFANLAITEIMYDPEGADTKREWIEIMNIGNEPVVVADWHFLENQVHHKLTPQDFQSLEPGERAVVVQDIATFQQEFSYNQFLIKSSFSLNNTGEELALSNKEKEVIFSILYSSEWGANGNGMSLQLINDDWGQAHPTPGEENAGEVVSPEEGENEEETPETETPKKSVETIASFLDIPQFFTARSSFPLEAFAIRTKDGKKDILGGYYFLNMGDGSFVESNDPLNFTYSYSYPGSYEIILEYYSSKLAFEAGEKPISSLSKKIKVADSSIEITEVDIETNIHIKNNTNTKVNLGGWKLFSKERSFLFPRNTYLEPSGSLVVPFRIHGILLSRNTYINLSSNQGVTVSTFLPFSQQGKPTFNENSNNLTSLESSGTEDLDSTIDSTDVYLLQNPDKIRVDFYKGEASTPFSDDGDMSKKLKNYTLYAAILAIVLVLLRVVLRAFLKKARDDADPRDGEEDQVIGDIELLK